MIETYLRVIKITHTNNELDERIKNLLEKNTCIDSKVQFLEKDLRRKSEVISQCVENSINVSGQKYEVQQVKSRMF